jgi:hypothetical protein
MIQRETRLTYSLPVMIDPPEVIQGVGWLPEPCIAQILIELALYK